MTQAPIITLTNQTLDEGTILIFHVDDTGINQYCVVNVTKATYDDNGYLDTVQAIVLKSGISNYRINARPIIKIGEPNFTYAQIIPPQEQVAPALPRNNALIVITQEEVDHTLDLLYKAIANFASSMATTEWCLNYVKELNLMPYHGKRAKRALAAWIRNDERFEAKGGYVKIVSLEIAKLRRKAKQGVGTPEAPAKEAFPLLAEDERYVDVTKVMTGVVALIESGILGKLIPVNIPNLDANTQRK